MVFAPDVGKSIFIFILLPSSHKPVRLVVGTGTYYGRCRMMYACAPAADATYVRAVPPTNMIYDFIFPSTNRAKSRDGRTCVISVRIETARDYFGKEKKRPLTVVVLNTVRLRERSHRRYCSDRGVTCRYCSLKKIPK